MLDYKPCPFIFDKTGIVGYTCSNAKESSALDKKCVMQHKRRSNAKISLVTRTRMRTYAKEGIETHFDTQRIIKHLRGVVPPFSNNYIFLHYNAVFRINLPFEKH